MVVVHIWSLQHRLLKDITGEWAQEDLLILVHIETDDFHFWEHYYYNIYVAFFVFFNKCIANNYLPCEILPNRIYYVFFIINSVLFFSASTNV